MSVNQIPAGDKDNWSLIASATPTSGTVVSFTSIAANWRKLWLVTKGPITSSGSGFYPITVNSLTGTDDYRYFRLAGSATQFVDETSILTDAAGTVYNFNVIFENPAGIYPFVQFDGWVARSQANAASINGYVINATTAITQIDITLTVGNYGTNTGIIYLYGTY
jgi:hypothetical protein